MNNLQEKLLDIARIPVAIIGGGMSGLYTGWRLQQQNPGQRVVIFEGSDRTGGRLFTWMPYGRGSGLRAELGGMRFFKEQQMVWNLVQELGLEIVDFFATGPNTRLYLRGQSGSMENPSTVAKRYMLAPEEQGKSAGDLIEGAIKTVLGTAENRAVLAKQLEGRFPETREDWDQIKGDLTYNGKPLWTLGFWNVLSEVLSYEAYQYTTDTFGYYSLTTNWNAAEAMQNLSIDFTQDPDYKTLANGYSSLPDRLRAEFERMGGKVMLNCRLVRLEAHEDKSFSLFFQDAQGVEARVRADKVVLGMPRRALEQIQPSKTWDPAANPTLRYLLDSVQAYPAFKLFLLYEFRWWEEQGIVHGRSVSDLPIRQTYYFRPDACEQNAGGAGPGYGLVMASYDDARAVDFWKGLELAPEAREQARKELKEWLSRQPKAIAGLFGAAGPSPEPPPNMHKAPKEMMIRAKEQLALLHDLDPEEIPDPVFGAYADWSLEPYGGGWFFWEPQVDVEPVMKRIKEPLEGYPLYIVGDAYSGSQGWVEGALTTAEIVLQQKFGLEWPVWLPQGYYLGW
ncbi:MAG TPA: NAD(P)/FAD-dependent oxidoreductase [Symbiobacteriaceae bacterium]|nr:NAD(P)/FAD-dependent oxidoreductase [Symbiobacteriaceae bacterium]